MWVRPIKIFYIYIGDICPQQVLVGDSKDNDDAEPKEGDYLGKTDYSNVDIHLSLLECGFVQ